METVRIVFDKEVPQATNRAARSTRQDGSALVRDALREHPRRLEARALEKLDRAGYSKQPQEREESVVWETAVVWP